MHDAAPLGRVHGLVGALDQLLWLLPLVGQGDPDARSQPHLLTLDRQCLPHPPPPPTPGHVRPAPAPPSRSAVRPATSAPSTSRTRATNSSPPKRLTTSPGRTHAKRRPATPRRRASPARCPSLSLTLLKPSRSRKKT